MKKMSRLNLVALAVGAFCLGLMLHSDAFAQDRNPCSDDIAKFCKNVKNDMRSLLECLEEHESELTDACKAYEERMGGSRVESREITRQRKAIILTCKDDVDKFCKDVDPKDGGILKCLNEHEKELSTPCNGSLKAAKSEEKKAP